MRRHQYTCVILACVVALAVSAGAGQEVAEVNLAREMRGEYPKIRKLGVVSPRGEVSPFVFKGRLMRLELLDPSRGLEATNAAICACVIDAESGNRLSTLGQDCYYFSAFAEKDRVIVLGTERQGGRFSGDTIWAFESRDLMSWSRRILLRNPGWRYFNTSLTKGKDGYVLLMESNTKPYAGQPFTMFFAMSKDLKDWKLMDPDIAFPKDRYAGGPFIYWHNGFYYVSLVTALPNERYATYLYRTQDFRKWNCGLYNPLLICSQEDRTVSPKAVDITPSFAEEVKTRFICSASDLEFCAVGDKTYLNYVVGDQHGFYSICEAWYDGTPGELLEGFFGDSPIRAADGSLDNSADAGSLTWGGRVSHPAVVNPVLGQDNVISLRGEWEFSEPRKDLPNRNGIWGNFNAKQEWAKSRKILVPGCWEAQGVGEPGESESWDPKWDHNAKPIRHKYMGEGWYRREVDIPSTWAGCRIWIKIGGVKSVGWVWVNDRQVAHVANYCGTEKFEITDLVEPGKRTKIVIDVDNRKPSRKGLMSAMHKWGGLYRDVELEATPTTFIDDAWVRGDFDRREAEAHITIGGPAVGRVRIEIAGKTVLGEARSGENILRVPLGDFRAWSPQEPNLYTAKVELVSVDGEVVQTRRERFGVRKFEVRGKEFYLNGRPFFARGFGDDHVYPLTGMTPADRDVHRAHLARARAAGFNFVRLHTHCEVPEYFEAADELGILVQAELPYYSDVPCESFEFDPVRDVTELWRNYRRHPSFAVYSMGNEGSFGPVLDERLYRYVKQMDPDRLKINQDSNVEHMNLPTCADYRGGPIVTWPRGTCDFGRPFICHEYLNLCVKSDSRDAGKYIGAWLPPVTRADREKWLREFGLDHFWGDRLQDAQHVLQRYWQKQGIEAARSDPHCDGFSFWTLVDVVVRSGETFSAQGLFNPFWETKRGGYEPQEFATFNGDTVLFAESALSNRIATCGECVPMMFRLSHYGLGELPRTDLVCRLRSGGLTLAETRVAAGELGSLATGPAHDIGAATWVAPLVSRPTRATLEVALGGVRNEWTWWIFPKRERKTVKGVVAEKGFLPILERLYEGVVEARPDRMEVADVVVARTGSSIERAAIAAGKRLLSVANENGAADVALGWWWMETQVGTAIRAGHPAFGELPVGGALDELLFRTVRRGAMELPVKGMVGEEMLIVGEGGDACRVYLGEMKVGSAQVLRSSGLALFAGLPETNCLLDGLIGYLRTAAPKVKVACVGDSITYGWHLQDRAKDAYPAQLQLLLDEKAPGRYVVHNFGNPGRGVYTHTKFGGSCRAFSAMREHAEAIAWNPDLVICNLGANDWEEFPKETEGKIERGLFRREYGALLRQYQALGSHPKIGIWTRLAPLTKAHPEYDKPVVAELDAELVSVAHEAGVEAIDMQTPLMERLEENIMADDGIHPTAVGCRRIAVETCKYVLGEREK